MEFFEKRRWDFDRPKEKKCFEEANYKKGYEIVGVNGNPFGKITNRRGREYEVLVYEEDDYGYYTAKEIEDIEFLGSASLYEGKVQLEEGQSFLKDILAKKKINPEKYESVYHRDFNFTKGESPCVVVYNVAKDNVLSILSGNEMKNFLMSALNLSEKDYAMIVLKKSDWKEYTETSTTKHSMILVIDHNADSPKYIEV